MDKAFRKKCFEGKSPYSRIPTFTCGSKKLAYETLAGMRSKDSRSVEREREELHKASNESQAFIQSRLSDYVDHCFGLMVLNMKMEKLKRRQEAMMTGLGLAGSSEDEDDDEMLYYRKGKKDAGAGLKGNKTKGSNSKPEARKPRTYFTLYNQYSDCTSELNLDEGVFSVQIDVGGSSENEILIDSKENHLKVKAKDSKGERHVFGIICPTADDVDKLNIHLPKNGLLKIKGPQNKR